MGITAVCLGRPVSYTASAMSLPLRNPPPIIIARMRTLFIVLGERRFPLYSLVRYPIIQPHPKVIVVESII